MVARKMLLMTVGLIALLGTLACAPPPPPPPHDAKAISEGEMDGDIQPAPQPAAGGGSRLRESQW